MMELNPEDLGAMVNRLRRAEGQIGGILRMIEQGRDCKDIVTQLVAVNHALDRAGLRRRSDPGEALPFPCLRTLGADSPELLIGTHLPPPNSAGTTSPEYFVTLPALIPPGV